jgi:hypothetical protein
MAKKNLWFGILVMALAFGMTVVGCGDGDSNNDPPPPPPPPPPAQLTGTVTVSSNATLSSGTEIMRLTADTSGLNGVSGNYRYQWLRDGVNIAGAQSQTYDIVSADHGRNMRVRVTSVEHTGEAHSTPQSYTPTTLILTLRRHATNWEGNTGITIERGSGGSFPFWASTSGDLTAAGTTITLTSWVETSFKIRTTYTFMGTGYYFKHNNASGSETFNFTNGTRTYTLSTRHDSGWGFYYDSFAVEG